jgi:hypothetical protein
VSRQYSFDPPERGSLVTSLILLDGTIFRPARIKKIPDELKGNSLAPFIKPSSIMTEGDKNIAMIGRGESALIVGQDTVKADADVPTAVVEGDEEADDVSEKEAEANGLLEESAGWIFPKIKLSYWDPENEKQWAAAGKRIADRNLIASIPNLTCAFGVWLVWSVIATEIQKMHDKDSKVFAFEDWGSPKGTDVSEICCCCRSKV